MNNIIEDDRTEQEKTTHTILIKGNDTFLSNWGEAEGGVSVACWACKPEHKEQVHQWVKNRSDMESVRVVSNSHRFKAEHTHIYLVDDNHISLNKE